MKVEGLVFAGVATADNGNVAAFLAARDHVNVFVYDGGIVPDPHGLITAGHDNKTARTIGFREADDVGREPAPSPAPIDPVGLEDLLDRVVAAAHDVVVDEVDRRPGMTVDDFHAHGDVEARVFKQQRREWLTASNRADHRAIPWCDVIEELRGLQTSRSLHVLRHQ